MIAYTTALLLMVISITVFILKMRRAAVFVIICAFVSLYPLLYNLCSVSKAELLGDMTQYTATVGKISYGQDTNELCLEIDTGKLFPASVKAIAVTDSISEDIRRYDRIIFESEPLFINAETTDGNLLKNSSESYISEGYRIVFRVKDTVSVEGRSNHPKHLFYNHITARLNGTMSDYGGTDGFSYTMALVTGDRSGIPAETYRDFTRSGLVPFLCISGLHVAVTCSVLAKLLALLKTGKKLRGIILLIFLQIIAIITGGSVPIVRAVLMSSILIILTLSGYKTDSLSVLFTAFCIMSFINPYFIFSTGSALSFLATAGIYCLNASGNSYRGKSRIYNFIADGINVGFFAAGFTVPVMISIFGGFNLLSPVSNLVASVIFVPLMYLLVILALIAFLPGVVLYPLTFGILCLVRLFERCAEFFASVPFAYAEPFFPAPLVVLLAVLGFCTLFSCFSGNRRTVFVCGFVYAAVSYLSVAVLWIFQ